MVKSDQAQNSNKWSRRVQAPCVEHHRACAGPLGSLGPASRRHSGRPPGTGGHLPGEALASGSSEQLIKVTPVLEFHGA